MRILRKLYENIWLIPTDKIERFDKVLRIYTEYSQWDSLHWYDIADELSEYDEYKVSLDKVNDRRLIVLDMEEKPYRVLDFDKTAHQEYCFDCDKKTKQKVTPWVLRSFHGRDNLVRRQICLECGDWHESMITAAIVRGTVPQKKFYDKYDHKFNMSDIVEVIKNKDITVPIGRLEE